MPFPTGPGARRCWCLWHLPQPASVGLGNGAGSLEQALRCCSFQHPTHTHSPGQIPWCSWARDPLLAEGHFFLFPCRVGAKIWERKCSRRELVCLPTRVQAGRCFPCRLRPSTRPSRSLANESPLCSSRRLSHHEERALTAAEDRGGTQPSPASGSQHDGKMQLLPSWSRTGSAAAASLASVAVKGTLRLQGSDQLMGERGMGTKK